jgi:hypothetical protein
MNLTVDRFERRLSEEGSRLRVEMVQQGAQLRVEMSAIRQEMSSQRHEISHEMASMREAIAADRFELLKWAFMFWVGQFFAVGAMMATMLRLFGASR